MTLRQLISALTYFAEVEDFDLDEEVIVNLCDKNGDNITELPITDTDWNWKDFFDSEKRKKNRGYSHTNERLGTKFALVKVETN